MSGADAGQLRAGGLRPGAGRAADADAAADGVRQGRVLHAGAAAALGGHRARPGGQGECTLTSVIKSKAACSPVMVQSACYGSGLLSMHCSPSRRAAHDARAVMAPLKAFSMRYHAEAVLTSRAWD